MAEVGVAEGVVTNLVTTKKYRAKMTRILLTGPVNPTGAFRLPGSRYVPLEPKWS